MWLYASMNERKPQDQDKFVLRFPDGMRDLIKASAAASGRSMNAEIIHRLEKSYADETLKEMEEVSDEIRRDHLEARLKKALMERLLYELGSDLSTNGMQKLIDSLRLPEDSD